MPKLPSQKRRNSEEQEVKSLRQHYYVMRYDGSKVYCGRSLDKATEAWVGGTVIGQGPNADDARWDASKNLAKHLGSLGKPEPAKAV